MGPFDVGELRFHATRNAQYHIGRRRVLERYNRYANAATILLGTAIVADVASKIAIDTIWIGAAASCVGVAQLVFDFAGRARTHELLQRRYYDLIAAMGRTVEPGEADIAKWTGDLAQIYGDEPPTDPIADAIAYNEAGHALGMGAGDTLVIPMYVRLLNLIGLASGHRFVSRGEQVAPHSAADAG